ncbi:MAG TPA: translation elongation factor-like protein [Candidatus Atribacteria bacterium]|nr:translation elongation factor-like protein [Candidatus Atribacteria bacterium]
MAEVFVGKVTDYFAKIGVAALVIENGELYLGDTIHFIGHTTDFEQQINSMQIEHQAVESAKTGDAVGIKVKDRVRHGDKVYKVTAS